MPDRTKFTYAMLLERIKQATGPDRKLDNLIAWHLDEAQWWVADWGERQQTMAPRRFTNSIDDVVSLIQRQLPGWDLTLEIRQTNLWAVVGLVKPGVSLVGVNSAKTPTAPLALLEAMLEALIKAKKNPSHRFKGLAG